MIITISNICLIIIIIFRFMAISKDVSVPYFYYLAGLLFGPVLVSCKLAAAAVIIESFVTAVCKGPYARCC